MDEAPAAPSITTEITIASVPSGAKVLLEGAELGQTPYRLTVKEPTTISVTHGGYEAKS